MGMPHINLWPVRMLHPKTSICAAPGIANLTDVVACSGRERLKPAVDQAAGRVQPMTEDITRDVIRPGGKKVTEHAAPVTKQIAEQQVQPAVDQVGNPSLQPLAAFTRKP